MAVRLALGETHLVKENQEYFEKEGVDISVLESAKAKGGGKGAEERSSTVILVKNLPYGTQAKELAKRFGAFGDVSATDAWPVQRRVGRVCFCHGARLIEPVIDIYGLLRCVRLCNWWPLGKILGGEVLCFGVLTSKKCNAIGFPSCLYMMQTRGISLDRALGVTKLFVHHFLWEWTDFTFVSVIACTKGIQEGGKEDERRSSYMAVSSTGCVANSLT